MCLSMSRLARFCVVGFFVWAGCAAGWKLSSYRGWEHAWLLIGIFIQVVWFQIFLLVIGYNSWFVCNAAVVIFNCWGVQY